jgi:hypothetical protein
MHPFASNSAGIVDFVCRGRRSDHLLHRHQCQRRREVHSAIDILRDDARASPEISSRVAIVLLLIGNLPAMTPDLDDVVKRRVGDYELGR